MIACLGDFKARDSLSNDFSNTDVRELTGPRHWTSRVGAVVSSLVKRRYDGPVSGELKSRRFLTIEQAGEKRNVSYSQIRALLTTGELRAIQVGGRGGWRNGTNDVEDFIAEAYKRTAAEDCGRGAQRRPRRDGPLAV